MAHDDDLPGTSLSGTWRAAPADEAGRRDYQDPAFDDSSWALPPCRGTGGPTRRWPTPTGRCCTARPSPRPSPFGPGADDDAASVAERRSWLVLDGIFYTSDVWLDGTYLGDTEGYFFPHGFEVTEPWPRPPSTPSPSRSPARDRPTSPPSATSPACSSTGTCSTSAGTRAASGDRSASSSPARSASATPASGAGTSTTSGPSCRSGSCSTPSRPARSSWSPPSSPGRSRRAGRGATQPAPRRRREPGRVDRHRARPAAVVAHALGDQPLYDVHVEVLTESEPEAGRPGQRRAPMAARPAHGRAPRLDRHGQRRAAVPEGGEPGPDPHGAGRGRAGTRSPTTSHLARDAGLDLLRVHGHISRPELYDAADEAGMLLWQDLPLQWGYSRTVRQEARRQAREAVDLLAHHPSVFLWCGHNEPMAVDVEPATLGRPSAGAVASRCGWPRPRPCPAGTARCSTAPSRRCSSATTAPGRSWPTPACSPTCPSSTAPTPTSSSAGTSARSGTCPASWPAGPGWPASSASSARRRCPTTTPSSSPSAGPTSTGTGWPSTTRCRRRCSTATCRRPTFATYDDWKDATRRYQARVVRYHVETLRRLKYQPTGGFAQFCLADSSPAVSAALLDHERTPKPAYEALRDACRPVIVVADRPPEHVHPGDHLSLDVHVVTDARIAFRDMVLRAHLSLGTESRHAWSWSGTLEPDTCVRVGTPRDRRARAAPNRCTTPTNSAGRSGPADRARHRPAPVGDGLDVSQPLRHLGRRRCPPALTPGRGLPADLAGSHREPTDG